MPVFVPNSSYRQSKTIQLLAKKYSYSNNCPIIDDCLHGAFRALQMSIPCSDPVWQLAMQRDIKVARIEIASFLDACPPQVPMMWIFVFLYALEKVH